MIQDNCLCGMEWSPGLSRWKCGTYLRNIYDGPAIRSAACNEIARLRADASTASPSCDRRQGTRTRADEGGAGARGFGEGGGVVSDTNWQKRANAATALLRREAMKGDQAAQNLFDKYAPNASQHRAWERKEAVIEAKVRKVIAEFKNPLPVADFNPESTEYLGGFRVAMDGA